MRNLFVILALCLGVLGNPFYPASLSAQDFRLPPKPSFTKEGLQLFYDFEVGGGKSYYVRFLIHPAWPGLSSGVTIGVGWDCGYYSEDVLRQDWALLPGDDLNRLAKVMGFKGQSAKIKVSEVGDIEIRWELAQDVFERVTLAIFYDRAQSAYPGLVKLKPNAQAALTSLVFNRGTSMYGSNRREMADIADLVLRRDYAGIAAQLRSMKRLWPNTGGLLRRREAEARLVESCL